MKRITPASVGVVVVALALLSSCGPRVLPGLQGQIDFALVGASNPSPFSGVQSFEIELESLESGEVESFEVVFSEEIGQLGGADEARQFFSPGERVQATLRGLDLGRNARGLGRSQPFSMPAAGTLRVPIVLAVPDTLSVLLSEARTARHDGLALRISETEILWIGGKPTVAAGGLAPVVIDVPAKTLTEVDVTEDDLAALQVAFPAGCSLGDGRAVIAGGIVDRELEAYSAATFLYENGTLRRGEDLPQPRAGMHAACFPREGVAVFAGGLIAQAPFVTAAIAEVDVATGAVSDAVEAISFPRAFSSGADLVQAAGTLSLMSGGLFFSDGVWRPAASVDFIRRVEGRTRVFAADAGVSAAAQTDLVVARYGHTVVAIGSSALVYGGADESGPLADPAPLWFSPEFSSPGAFLPVAQSANGEAITSRVGAPGAFLEGTGTVLLVGGNPAGALMEIRVNLAQDIPALDVVTVTATEIVGNRGHRFGQAFALEDQSVVVVGGRGQSASILPMDAPINSDAVDILVPCSIGNVCRF